MTELRTHRATGGLRRATAALVAGLALGLAPACSSNDSSPPPTNTGAACTAVDQCYPGVKQGDLVGNAECLSKVTGGYCTHHCAMDADCCAVAGECPDKLLEVCAPFESTPDLYCFLSCEDADLKAVNATDADVFCHTYAGPTFGCRSTGGGAKNRKICMP